MSEILTRAEFKDELLGTDGNQGWADKLLAHDAALRLALSEAQRQLIAHVGIDCTADSPCLPCRRVLDAEKERGAAFARAESAEARLAEATRVMLALADERDPDVLTVMSTLLRAAGNTPQADLCALLAREVPKGEPTK